MVRETLEIERPTEVQIAEIHAAAARPVNYTDDSPRLSAEGRRKVNCTLRLSKTSLDWWKSLGDGYTSAMSRMLEEAQNYPELLKRII
ncbi:MAG: BrnA antitoxin family protein [Treponema sp.]|nr:BrnA antitoxin family protein [Treponema sp.]